MISSSDRNIIRVLARQVADIADLPIQPERRNPWKLHNSPKCTRPMILVFPEGSWQELLKADPPLTGERARNFEWELRSRIYHHEHFQDSTVIETGWKGKKNRSPRISREGRELTNSKRLQMLAFQLTSR